MQRYKVYEFEGDYYYVADGNKIVRNATVSLGASVQGICLENGDPLLPGRYTFDADGKMIIPGYND
jgi:hypothetical protein